MTRRRSFAPHPDYRELQELFPHVRRLQALASRHGIRDIFQDNGGKLLQLCLVLGIKVLPGREGNDAVDVTTGGEFELKTLNMQTGGGWTTHHHLNRIILEKYRRVDWIFAGYDGIELMAIWRLSPAQMMPCFADWEAKLDSGRDHINNPKVPRQFVLGHQPIWTANGTLEFTPPKRETGRSERRLL